MTEPPRAPAIDRKLLFPPRRVAAIALLALLPSASLAGAFNATEQRRSETAGLALSARFATRTLYREHELIEVEVRSATRCERAVVSGLSDYLDRFEDVRTEPTPTNTQTVYEGPIAAGERITLRIHGRPVEVGHASANLSLTCDGRQGPTVELSTLVFP
jgi:hypothetical protein